MSRKFNIISSNGEVSKDKVFELGFEALPIIASDGIKRSNSHYLYEPKFIGCVNSEGMHFAYMYVESFVKGVIVAICGKYKFSFVEAV